MAFTPALDAAIILRNGRSFTMDLTAISAQLEKYEDKWVAIDESEEKIVGVGDLGYGLNIAFSDGHDRGIYPENYLSGLADA